MVSALDLLKAVSLLTERQKAHLGGAAVPSTASGLYNGSAEMGTRVLRSPASSWPHPWLLPPQNPQLPGRTGPHSVPREEQPGTKLP